MERFTISLELARLGVRHGTLNVVPADMNADWHHHHHAGHDHPYHVQSRPKS